MYEPGDPDKATIISLHGTGGSERDLIPIIQDAAPGHPILSPLGKVRENGMPRFFARHADGSFDVEDLHKRTDEMAEFLAEAGEEYGFEPGGAIAFGYSNGANIAAAVMLKHPDRLGGGVLLRSMLPFRPDPLPDLSAKRILVASGENDPYISREGTEALIDLYRECGATVEESWYPGGHELAQIDFYAAQAFLAKIPEVGAA